MYAKREAGTRWIDYIPGDWRVIHLRDGCPFLPFTGRSTGQNITIDEPASAIEVRVPVYTVLGNLWQVLSMDAAVARAITAARTATIARLTNEVEHDASVRDLALLGQGIPAVMYSATAVNADTVLTEL